LEQFGVIGGFARFAAGGGWEGKKNAAEGRGQESTASLHEPITIKRHSGSEVYKELHLALLILLTMYYLTNTLGLGCSSSTRWAVPLRPRST